MKVKRVDVVVVRTNSGLRQQFCTFYASTSPAGDLFCTRTPRNAFGSSDGIATYPSPYLRSRSRICLETRVPSRGGSSSQDGQDEGEDLHTMAHDGTRSISPFVTAQPDHLAHSQHAVSAESLKSHAADAYRDAEQRQAKDKASSPRQGSRLQRGM